MHHHRPKRHAIPNLHVLPGKLDGCVQEVLSVVVFMICLLLTLHRFLPYPPHRVTASSSTLPERIGEVVAVVGGVARGLAS